MSINGCVCMSQFNNIPYFHAKAPTQMLWNAQETAPYNPMTHTAHDAELMRDKSRVAKVRTPISVQCAMCSVSGCSVQRDCDRTSGADCHTHVQVNSMIAQWNGQADTNPAGTDY